MVRFGVAFIHSNKRRIPKAPVLGVFRGEWSQSFVLFVFISHLLSTRRIVEIEVAVKYNGI